FPLFLLSLRCPSRSTLFPYTSLFRSRALLLRAGLHRIGRSRAADGASARGHPLGRPEPARPRRAAGRAAARPAGPDPHARPARAPRPAAGLGRRAPGVYGAAALAAEHGRSGGARAAAARPAA